MPVLTTILMGVSTSVIRSIGGWLENALEDGKIDNYEWGSLGATVFRVTLITVGVSLGFNLEPLAAAGTALVADFIVKALKR